MDEEHRGEDEQTHKGMQEETSLEVESLTMETGNGDGKKAQI